jgi:hypothetical protein
MPVYKGRDGRGSGIIAIPEGEVEGSRPRGLEGSAHEQALEVEGPCPVALGVACAHQSEKSKRRWFRNYHCRNQGHVLSP